MPEQFLTMQITQKKTRDIVKVCCVQVAGGLLALFFLTGQPARSQIILRDQFPSLFFNSPVGLYNAGDGTDRLFVVEQAGYIRVFPNSPAVTSTKTFLDIHDSIVSGGEEGLLGLAFHPNYELNGYFYVYYSRNNPNRSVIARFQVSLSNPDSAIRSGQVVILTQLQPEGYTNHKGGQIAFGPDGYLYIAFGDGGGGGDPFCNGQNKTTLLAKIARINIDSTEPGQNYAIPGDNPFVDSVGLKKEIYTVGMRNPWRFSFDQSTLWVADVGQGSWEEIDTVQNGKNYGWSYMEGFHVYDTTTRCGDYHQATLTPPIWEYGHGGGRCSITGGFVYRGADIPQLTGKYVYGDYCSADIWTLDVGQPSAINARLLGGPAAITSFGVDQYNELYLCGQADGKIRKFVLQPPGATTLVSPANGSTNVSRTPMLVWRTTAWASSYRLQVSTDSTFSTTTFDDSTITDTSMQMGLLGSGVKYFWRVRAKNSGGIGAYATKWNFTTINDAVPPPTPALLSPPPDAVDQPTPLTLVWSKSNLAATYHLQISTDSTFATLDFDDSTLVDTFKQMSALSYGTRYFWRANAKNVAGTSSFTAPGNFTTALHSASYHMQKGWNLLSLPVAVSNGRKSTLFPTAISNAFAYNPGGNYVNRDSLVPGVGYWIKFSDSQNVVISGTPIAADTVDIAVGWNMIGAVTSSVPIDSIVQLPPGIVLRRYFGYGAAYFETLSLEPSKGYWVKATSTGQLVIHSNGSIEWRNIEQIRK